MFVGGLWRGKPGGSEGSVSGVSLGAEHMEGVKFYVQVGGLWNR